MARGFAEEPGRAVGLCSVEAREHERLVMCPPLHRLNGLIGGWGLVYAGSAKTNEPNTTHERIRITASTPAHAIIVILSLLTNLFHFLGSKKPLGSKKEGARHPKVCHAQSDTAFS